MNRRSLFLFKLDGKTLLAVIVFSLLLGYICGSMFVSNVEHSGSNSPLFPVLALLFSSVGFGFNFITKNKIINTTTLLVALMFVFTLLNVLQSPVSTTRQYFELLLPASVSIFIYKFCVNDDRIDVIEKLSFYLLVGVFVYFIINYQNYSLSYVTDISVASAYSTYSCLYFFPLVLCNRNILLRAIGTLLVFVSVLLSLKRGGMICFSLALVAYLLYEFFRTNKSFSIKTIILIALLVLAGFYIFTLVDLEDSIVARFSELENAQDSSRMTIYSSLWKQIKEMGILSVLFGHGWNAVLYHCKLGFSAHNDYMEIYYDYGIFTLITLVILVIRLIVYLYKSIKKSSPFAGPLLACLIMLLVNTNISHIFFYGNYFTLFAMSWAFIIAKARVYEKDGLIS